MKYLTLEQLKKQCIIDEDFTDDDTYLESIGLAAENLVEQQVNEDLEDIMAENDNEMPQSLIQAMLLLVEFFYANRGTDDDAKIPSAFYYICRLYRNYEN